MKITYEEIVEKFRNNPKSYLTSGAGRLSGIWNVDREIILKAKSQIRLELKMEKLHSIETERADTPIKRMFFDIEISPCKGWFWRPSYKTRLTYSNVIEDASIICVSWKWQGEEKIHNLKWGKAWDDKPILEKFVAELEKADEVIGHNGDRFDIRWLRTRCLYHGIKFNTHIKTLDTLKKAKSFFNFPSNRLNDIGKYLNLGEKLQTEPDLWKEVCFKDNRKALNKMVAYCDQDVILLEDVYTAISSYTNTNTHAGVLSGKSKGCCPNCAEDKVIYLKPLSSKMGTIQRLMECVQCESDFIIANKTFKEYLKDGKP